MSIKWISSAWQNYLRDTAIQDRRIYIDFRQKQYPEIAGTPTFTLMTSADNKPGSHNLTGGYANYLLDMPSTFTLDIYFKPTFAYDVATDQYLWGWYVDATHYLSFRYDKTTDKYLLAWRDGGTERTMLSAAYPNSAALQVWTRATFALDLTTGTAAGSGFYLDGALVGDVWSGASDVKARYFPIFNVRNLTGTAGAFTVNYLRLFPSKVTTAAQVAGNFSTLKNEEIVWHYNGCALGHTRCNVTSRCRSADIERSIESPEGISNANSASIQIMSPQGQFADDQYAAFDATAELYNGTSAQKYMRHRTPIEIETWYGGLYELEFIGRVDNAMYSRHTAVNEVSMVALNAYDMVADIKRRVRQKAYKFENYNLSDPTVEASSLIHVIGKMGTQTEWYNFLANSSFENATIANSWTVAGAGATIAKAAGGIFGSNEGQLDYGAATASIYQTVDFTGTKKLNVGQTWNFSIYLKCANAATGTIVLSGYDDIVEDESAHTHYSLAGGEGWRKYEVSYTVADATVDHLRCTVTLNENVVLSFDGAMLIQNGRALDWFILNNNDGASGEEIADDADSSLFDLAGYDVDDAMVVHPWAVVEGGVPIWDYLSGIADATAARYMGMDACGTLKYRTPFKTGYADPSALITVDAAGAVDSVVSIEQANKIVIHGIRIVKEDRVREVWSAEKSSFFDRDGNGYVYETVANGATWPDPATYGEFWAKYEEGRLMNRGDLVITGVVP